MAPPPEKLLLAAPRGYCAGVDRAVQTVERALELYGAPVYVRKEIVHNKHVVEQLRDRGAVFVESETEVPEEATVVYRTSGTTRRQFNTIQPTLRATASPTRHAPRVMKKAIVFARLVIRISKIVVDGRSITPMSRT